MPLTYARSSRAAPIASSPRPSPTSFVPDPSAALVTIFQYWQYIRSLAIHLTSWRFPQKTKSWQNSAAGWSIFRNPRNLHARENWWNKTVKPRNGTLANLWTLHLLTDSYIYIYTRIFFLERRLNILDPGYSVTTILSTEKYNRDIEKNIIFSSREFVRKV